MSTDTDRELLEAAARAAGIVYQQPKADMWPGGLWTTLDGCRWWNPLTDDGDALRLAVKLDLLHTYDMDQVAAMTDFDATDPDPYAATRRAIVRAAAALGEQA